MRLKQQYYADKRFHPSVIGVILVVFLVSVAAFISYMEDISYFDAFYACFITYSTIGFGDIDIFVRQEFTHVCNVPESNNTFFFNIPENILPIQLVQLTNLRKLYPHRRLHDSVGLGSIIIGKMWCQEVLVAVILVVCNAQRTRLHEKIHQMQT